MVVNVDWVRVQEIFAEALALPPAERSAYLDRADIGDEERHEVMELLASHDAPGPFLDEPVLPRLKTEVLPPGWEIPAPAEVGRMVGPYKLRRVIGEGGMGAVYLATRDDDEYRREVAVKLIRHRQGAEALVRFKNERQILAALEHPNIARLYDGGTADDGRPYLVMEYVEGVRLDTYAANAALDVEARLRLFRVVCSAVAYAHRSLLVHRDLKPANILVTAEGVPKLLDFGIAKSLADGRDAGTTRPGQYPMTPAYASPEQVRGNMVTTASDVYSLGVVLYELLLGQGPYRLDDSSDVTLQKAIRDQDPVRPSLAARTDETTSTLASSLRGDLDTILLKALRKEPEHRYTSVSAFSEDIGRYLDNLPVLARRAGLSYRARKFVRRHRWGVAAAALALMVLVGFIVALVRQTGISDRHAQLSAKNAEVAMRERDRAEKALDFIATAFKTSDPEQARGREVTAREILDQGAAKVRRELHDEPDLRATLLGVIGEVYVSLGLFDEAAPLLHEAHELRRDGANEAVSLYQLGELEYWRVDYQAAERHYRKALEMLPPQETPARGRVLRGLGLALVWLERNEEGEALLTEALAVLRGHFEDRDAEILRCIEGLAWAARNQGNYAKAEELFQEVVAVRRPEGSGPALGRTLADLGFVRFKQGELNDARELLEEALPMLREAMGGDNAYVAEVLGKLAPILMRLGDDIAAEAVIREILAILSEEHPGTGIALSNLGAILGGRGELDEAERITTKALRLKRAALGDTPSVALTICVLGGIAFERADFEEARGRYEDCAAMMEAVHPPNHPQIGFALWGLGRSVEAMEGCEAAVQWWQRAYKVRRDGLGAEHYLTAMAASRLGACLGELGRDDEAERLLVDSLEVLQGIDRAWSICDAAKRLRAFYRERGDEEKLRAVAVSSCK